MPDTLQKLRPDRDLQCYFFRPSAIAALSGTSATGLTVSGSWRQQFDWAVIEWNRDNVFEHPAFRCLPDGDLSGLTLTYDETRQSCIPVDSDLFPTVDWPSLRVWADDGTGEKIYKVPLKNYASPIQGNYHPATVQFQLGGTATAGDYVGFAFLTEHYSYLMHGGDTPQVAIDNIVAAITAFSPTMQAANTGSIITLTYIGAGQTIANSTTGANGNRIGVYTFVSGSQTEQWDASSRLFTGGASPTQWRMTLPFAGLTDPILGQIPSTAIRKLRWTYSADLQPGAYARSEFQVVVSNWTVAGTRLSYSIAGPGSRRIEDDSTEIRYINTGAWTSGGGNFSGGTIHSTVTNQSAIQCTYTSAQQHSLYLGTRLADSGTLISFSVDGQSGTSVNLNFPGEDVLARKLLGVFGAGSHSVTVTHVGAAGTYFYFDFLELAIPATTLETQSIETTLTAATDWDTDHSIALAPERTAWMIDSLGFHGRVNHYAGALWFYELLRTGHQYASGTITFSGVPDPNLITQIILGRTDSTQTNVIEHLNVIGDTIQTLAKAFELELNRGYTAIRAQANANQLTIYSRSMGEDGDKITIATSANTTNLTIQTSGPALANGADGDWRTDLGAMPRLNRAARDWSQSFFQALNGYGIDGTVSFSMELQHGDPSDSVGIAQRYPSQDFVQLNTPAIQTNFSPASVAFWQQIYTDMAGVLVAAGLVPYLQFGEVQWWYFAGPLNVPLVTPGMPFYDAYTTSTFLAEFGRPMAVISSNTVDPSTIPQEAAFLPALIGSFTSQIRSFVRATYPNCRFEVLYPTDVNNTPLNQVINYPQADWTPANLNCLKTESFIYTGERNLDLAHTTITTGTALGFPASQRSFLVGVSDPSTSWLKEARLAEANGLQSVVLFALDQLCLVGYSLPLSMGLRRSAQFG